MESKPLINKSYILKKFQGASGWTYAELPEIKPNKNRAFGMVRVRGFIDNHEIKQYNLMPHGNGTLFLPVKASIRKAIGKQAGDSVTIKLWKDETLFEIPEEILNCFDMESPEVHANFKDMSEFEQRDYINWIYAAKTEKTKTNRIVIMLKRVAEKKRRFDP